MANSSDASNEKVGGQLKSVTSSSPSTMSSSPASSVATGLNESPSSNSFQVPRIDYTPKPNNLTTPPGNGERQRDPPIVDKTPSHRLGETILSALKQNKLDFPINEECTSLAVHPSGRFVLAGFCDGTLRIFPMELVRKAGCRPSNRNPDAVDDGDDDDDEEHEADLDEWDAASSNESTKSTGTNGSSSSVNRRKSKGTTRLVSSAQFQKYGAVACQIHARGVHTDLLMHVECSQDGEYCFAGVQRGSMELYAVYLGDLVRNFNPPDQQPSDGPRKNLLEYLRVYVHSDGKLKGFGACVRVLPQKGDQAAANATPKYMLLTGLGIKNIHIWSFEPPVYDKNRATELKPAKWVQLYDTQTNGNTISLLSFVYTPANHKLLAVSKSDRQKLRLWDLSGEQKQTEICNEKKARPKRPHYKDVLNTEAGLAIAGSKFCICGGDGMYNQMSIVSLDHAQSVYNHTELELPVADSESSLIGTVAGDTPSSSRRRRPQRGDLKQLANVASMSSDASHVMLELDDGALVHYTSQTKGSKRSDKSDRFPRLERVPKSAGIPELPGEFYSRKMCLANLHGQVVVTAVSLYNPNTGHGSIAVRALEWISEASSKKMKSIARANSSPQVSDLRAIQDCVKAPPGKKKKRKAIAVGETDRTYNGDSASCSSTRAKNDLDPRPPKRSVGKGVKLFSSGDAGTSSFVTPQHRKHDTSDDRKDVSNAKVQLSKVKGSGLPAPSVNSSSADTTRLPLAQTVSPEQPGACATPRLVSVSISSQISDVTPKNMALSESVKKNQKSTKTTIHIKTPSVDDKNSGGMVPKQKGSKKAYMQHQDALASVTKNKSVIDRRENACVQKLNSIQKDCSEVNQLSSSPITLLEEASNGGSPPVPRKKKRKICVSNEDTEGMTHLQKVPSSTSTPSQSKEVIKGNFLGNKGAGENEEKNDQIGQNYGQQMPNLLVSTPLPSKRSGETGEIATPSQTMQNEAKKSSSGLVPAIKTSHNDESGRILVNEIQSKSTKEVLEVSEPLNEKTPNQEVGCSRVTAGDFHDSTEVLQAPTKDCGVTNKDMGALHDVANVLCQLKSPSCTPAKNKRGSPNSSVSSTSPKRPKTSTPANKKTPKRKVTKSVHPYQDEVFLCQYQRLRALLDSLPESRLSFSKLFPSSDVDLEERQEAARNKLAAEHHANHELIRKRLLQSAVATSRLFLDSCLSAEEAKANLADDVRSYKELLLETLNRQEFEASTLAAQQTFQRGGLPAESVKVSFPFSSTFAVVDEMVEAISSRRCLSRAVAPKV